MKLKGCQSFTDCRFIHGNKTLKCLSAAVLAACTSASFQSCVQASEIDLSQKPVGKPTLEYLKDNNILIPQKEYERDASGNILKDENGNLKVTADTPIQSPGSAYTIVDGTEENHAIEYKTADEDGNISSKYYNIKYTEPADYETVEDQATTEFLKTELSRRYYAGGVLKVKEGETTSITNKLFINNKSSASESDKSICGGALYNAGTIKNLTADFINNYADSYYSYGGAVYNSGTIENIIGDFIGNYHKEYSSGGAIYNSGTIGSITGDFINNYIYYYSGGAIYNSGTIGSITGDFINNYTITSSTKAESSGGAVYNSGTIGSITGDFINNYTITSSTTTNRNSYGGAIYNSGTIGNITGDFINNYASSDAAYSSGGAIYNSGTIGNITGDFINNYASSDAAYSYGGAIYNSGTIAEKDSDGNVVGGIINSNFYNNCAKSTSGTAKGGAIWTDQDLNIIADNGTSTFKGNYVQVGDGEKDYTAIFAQNTSSIHDIITTPTLNFLAKNNGQITLNDKIVGESDTIYRLSYSYEEDPDTGMDIEIFRELDINDNEISGYKYWYDYEYDSTIDDDIEVYHILDIDNNETETVYKLYYGDNNYQIFDKDNNLIEEYSYWDYERIDGLYIHYLEDKDGNEKIIKSYSEFFVVALNTPEPTPSLVAGSVNFSGDSTGVINIYNDIKDMKVNVDTVTINMADGKMHNYEFLKLTSDDSAKYIMDIDPINNTSDKITTTTESEGVVTIGALRVENVFATNLNDTYKIQILDTQTDTLQLALSNEIKSQAAKGEYRIGFSGEEIVDEIKTVTNWKDKYNISEKQTNIYGKVELDTTKTTNDSIDLTITKIEKGVIVLKESQGDTLALWNSLDTEETKNFNFDSAKDVYIVAKDNPEALSLGETKGLVLNVNGIIDNAGNRSTINLNNRQGFEVNDSTTLNINNITIANGNGENGSVINVTNTDAAINLTNVNLVKNTSTAEGGAIYSNADVNITADKAVSEISGNSANGEKEAIYMANLDKTLTLNIVNSGKLLVNDKINGEQGYNVKIIGDNSGTFGMYNDIYNANVSIGNITLNTVNNSVYTYNFDKLTLTDDINFVADVDLKNAEMDRLTATSYGKHEGSLNVSGMNLLSDAKEDKTEIYFAEQGLKDNVTNGTGELPDANQTVYTPIYKYNVSYDNRDDGGYFVFNRGGGAGGNSSVSAGGNASDSFNPAVLSAPVSSVAASQATINETFKYVFEHADVFTKLPEIERVSRINANKYAISTDFDGNRGSLCYDHNNTAGWFRPYVTFEKMSLNHGPKVDAVTYGSLAGFDTDFHEHRNGWYSVGTGYVGYNGSQLHYNGVSTTMNGGLLGYTHTMYKGNFWSALTLSAGASVGESRTMYGKEDFTSLMAGLGSKTGYNFEFKEGKYILQPIMFMSYTFVNTFDYTNAAGVRVKPSPAHSIQLNPSVRFITNTKNGWQPYVSAGVVWNVMNENKVLANNVRLPEMSMKPYVEYGVGVQRNWKDKFTAFGQAMLRNGGRNGIALTGGFRWALGTEGKPIEKVQDKEVVHTAQNDAQRKVIKQLSSAQRTSLGASPQSTSRTTHNAILKTL